MAYADVKKLSNTDVGIGVDGKPWLFINRAKTKASCHIPLLPVAAALLKKYEHHAESSSSAKLLPVLSNQKTNSYLKEIADL